MQEVDVSVPPQAVELGLLPLMATMPEGDHCFPWHPCPVLEPSKGNVLGRASGRCWGCSCSPCAGSDICNLFELVLHWLPSLSELFLSGLSVQWQSKTRRGKECSLSKRRSSSGVEPHEAHRLPPGREGRNFDASIFSWEGRGRASLPHRRQERALGARPEQTRLLLLLLVLLFLLLCPEPSLRSVPGISCMGVSTALPVTPRAASALGSSDTLARGVSVEEPHPGESILSSGRGSTALSLSLLEEFCSALV